MLYIERCTVCIYKAEQAQICKDFIVINMYMLICTIAPNCIETFLIIEQYLVKYDSR